MSENPATALLKNLLSTYSLLSVKMLSMHSASLSFWAFSWRKEEKTKRNESFLNKIFWLSGSVSQKRNGIACVLYLQCWSRWSFPPFLCWCWACPPAGNTKRELTQSCFTKYKLPTIRTGRLLKGNTLYCEHHRILKQSVINQFLKPSNNTARIQMFSYSSVNWLYFEQTFTFLKLLNFSVICLG